ncbi:F-box only protein 7-like [Argonauta hians]
MKLRIRLGSTTKVIPIDDEIANFVQLSELRRLIQESFGDSLTGSFSLSLNKVDTFKDETQTLKDCEIVSGDLLHIISDSIFTEPNQKKTKPLEPQMNTGESNSSTSECRDDRKISKETPQPHITSPRTSGSSDDFGSPHFIKGDKISLQMFLSESSPKNVHQSLIVALHYLMFDSGFYLCRESQTSDVNSHEMCSDVKNQLKIFSDVLKSTEYYKLYYFHPFSKEALCLMICIPMATKLVINGKIVLPKVSNSCVPKAIFSPKDYVNEDSSSPSYRKLPKLTRIFKDTFVLRMLGELKHALGYADYNGLLGLHSEIMLKIMFELDMQSLSKFSQVCRHIWNLSRDNLLWRAFCQRDFKDCEITNSDTDWKKEYKALYETRRTAETTRASFDPMFSDMPYLFYFPPPASHPLAFPTYGGDYDIHPDYFTPGSRFFRGPFI